MTEVSLKLTKRSAESLPPKSAKYVAWDSEVSGFGIRIMPSGSKSYILKYRIGRGRSAKTRTITLGKLEDSTPEASRRLARDCKAEARLGQDPFKTEEHLVDDGTQTFAELFETWQEKAAHISRRTGALRKAANVKLDVDRLKIHVLPLLGDKPINQIKLADIANVRDQITSGATRTQKKTKPRGVRRASGGAGTAKRTIGILSSVFAYAVEHEILDRNPCKGVRLAPSKSNERFLTEAEAGRLGEVLKNWESRANAKQAVTIIRLLSLTGARRSEISELKWSEIDFDQGFLRLGDTKTGMSIRPISKLALDLLDLQPREHEKWVFPASTGPAAYQGLGKIWRQIRIEAGLEDVRMHDLRHSFASFGAAKGLSLPMIGALLGHKSFATTQRYAHLTNSAAQKAAEEIGRVVGDAMDISLR
ncbi:MAG: tyrosine-type recombinase/integrase [Henriciella sp.]